MFLFNQDEVFESLHKSREENIFQRAFNNVPEVKPLSPLTGMLAFAGMAFTGITIGAAIGTYVFFGTVTLAGFIALSESNKYIKYIVAKGNKTIDLVVFGATLYATITLGVTITAALTVAGLGYTLVYAPYVRKQSLLTKGHV